MDPQTQDAQWTEKGSERRFEEIMTKPSQIWGNTWIHKSKMLNELQVESTQRTPYNQIVERKSASSKRE